MASYRFDLQGGIERASYEVAHELVELGHDVTLVATDVVPRPSAPLKVQSVSVRPHPKPLTPLVFSRAATRQLDFSQFDVSHNQGGCALRRQDVITAHSCHRAWWELKKHHGERARAYLNPHHHAILRVETANYRPGAFQQVIAVSAGVKAEISRFYGVPDDQITVIPNGVDLAQFRPTGREALRSRIRADHGFTGDDVVLIFVGKEFRRKGLRPIIEALPGLPASTKLLVVGGDADAPFRRLAGELGVGDRVVFTGHTDEVEGFFQAGDLFVLPTLYEAFALVTLEAAAAGLPVVATKVNGTEDLVQDGVNGRFIERDAGSIRAVLEPLVRDRQARVSMGARARSSVEAYSWGAVAQRTAEVYERAVAERSRR